MDFGFYQSSSIGNQVWIDNNVNNLGIRNVLDGGDTPLSGAILKLYSINFMTGLETFIDSTISNSSGNYLFQNLEAKTYFIEIEANNTILTTIM